MPRAGLFASGQHETYSTDQYADLKSSLAKYGGVSLHWAHDYTTCGLELAMRAL